MNVWKFFEITDNKLNMPTSITILIFWGHTNGGAPSIVGQNS